MLTLRSRRPAQRGSLAGAAPDRRRIERRITAAAAFLIMALFNMGALFGLNVFRVSALVIGGSSFVYFYRHPVRTLKFAMVWIPISPVALSLIYKLGMPGAFVKNLVYLRPMLILAVFARGLQEVRTRRIRLDAFDRVVLGLLGIQIVYLVASPLLDREAVIPFTGRLQALQGTALFLMVALGVRWLQLDRMQRRSMERVFRIVLVAVALIGLYQKFFPHEFQQHMFLKVGIGDYLKDIAKLSGTAYSDVTNFYFYRPIRPMSLFLAPFDFADFMLAGACFGLWGMARRLRWDDVVLTGLCSACVVLSDVRINIIALGVALLAAILFRGTSEAARVRFFALALVAALAAAPLVADTRLFGEDKVSDEGHKTEITDSIERIVERPLGWGVGADASIARRYTNTRGTVAGGTYLAFGIYFGVLAFLSFIVITIQAMLRTRPTRAPDHNVAGAALLMLLSGVVAAQTHQIWVAGVSVGPVLWIWIGMAMSPIPPDTDDLSPPGDRRQSRADLHRPLSGPLTCESSPSAHGPGKFPGGAGIGPPSGETHRCRRATTPDGAGA